MKINSVGKTWRTADYYFWSSPQMVFILISFDLEKMLKNNLKSRNNQILRFVNLSDAQKDLSKHFARLLALPRICNHELFSPIITSNFFRIYYRSQNPWQTPKTRLVIIIWKIIQKENAIRLHFISIYFHHIFTGSLCISTRFSCVFLAFI